jgi:murein DD-endopeptidase MepM/ murein hydrolase activator NlpD
MEARASRQRDVAHQGASLRRSAITTRTVLGMIPAVALATGVAAMAPGAAALSQGASVLALVPGSQLGQYRHGTYPSSGNRTHAGVDIVAPCGTPVLAPEAGTIVDRIPSRSDPDFPSLGYMAIVAMGTVEGGVTTVRDEAPAALACGSLA